MEKLDMNIEFVMVQLNQEQNDFLLWTQKHYQQLCELRKMGGLDVKRGRVILDFDSNGKIGTIQKIENFNLNEQIDKTLDTLL